MLVLCSYILSLELVPIVCHQDRSALGVTMLTAAGEILWIDSLHLCFVSLWTTGCDLAHCVLDTRTYLAGELVASGVSLSHRFLVAHATVRNSP